MLIASDSLDDAKRAHSSVDPQLSCAVPKLVLTDPSNQTDSCVRQSQSDRDHFGVLTADHGA